MDFYDGEWKFYQCAVLVGIGSLLIKYPRNFLISGAKLIFRSDKFHFSCLNCTSQFNIQFILNTCELLLLHRKIWDFFDSRLMSQSNKYNWSKHQSKLICKFLITGKNYRRKKANWTNKPLPSSTTSSFPIN